MTVPKLQILRKLPYTDKSSLDSRVHLRHTIEIIQTEVQWSKYHFKIFLKQEAGNNTEKG